MLRSSIVSIFGQYVLILLRMEPGANISGNSCMSITTFFASHPKVFNVFSASIDLLFIMMPFFMIIALQQALNLWHTLTMLSRSEFLRYPKTSIKQSSFKLCNEELGISLTVSADHFDASACNNQF